VTASGNQIVVYQPNESVRLDVRLENETVWLNRHQMAQLFGRDVKTFNAQYPKLSIRYNETFHDRFLIIDDKELYLIGASLKDLGKKCFAFTKLDAGEIRRIKKSAFGASTG